MKRLKLIGSLAVVFAIVCANVWNTATTLQGSELNVESVEMVAEGNVEEISATDKRGTCWKPTRQESYGYVYHIETYQWYKCGKGGDWEQCTKGNTWRCRVGSGETPPRFTRQWMPSELERPVRLPDCSRDEWCGRDTYISRF
ncbi:MAG: hypothetical protein IKP08_08040 [Bacteroidales bacterium]|nr:hypothetical protein [Bacteroidales bacterium]